MEGMFFAPFIPMVHPRHDKFQILLVAHAGKIPPFVKSANPKLIAPRYSLRICGRYGRRADKQGIAEAMKAGYVNVFEDIPPKYNIAPTDIQPVVRISRKAVSGNLPIDLLRPFPADEMDTWKVSSRVGNVKNNEPSLVLPI
jgi:hypothetical protein